jgi:hypothetical protein
MFQDHGGWLWLLIDVVAVAILAAAIIYGTTHWRKRRRSRMLNQARDDATDRLYDRR